MKTVSVENPEEVDTRKCDSSGRLNLGKDYAGKEVSYIIEYSEEADEKDDS